MQKILNRPGNLPDISTIEPCWAWMKKHINPAARPVIRRQGKWNRGRLGQISHRRLQHWIKHLIYHIQIVIELEGGNEYKERCEDRDTLSWTGRQIKA
jgi:hypothetical protein